jgi:hypothetical protein
MYPIIALILLVPITPIAIFCSATCIQDNILRKEEEANSNGESHA